MKTPPSTRRSQAERRAATQALLLSAARNQFGTHGYGETNLEDIAAECGMTIGPIYHYFKNKIGMFDAVVDQIEHELVEDIQGRESADVLDVWTGFIAKCENPKFRQIMLIDGPVILGRKRMMDGPITKAVRMRTAKLFGSNPDGLSMNMLMAALSSAAIYIAENGSTEEDYDKIKNLIGFYGMLGGKEE